MASLVEQLQRDAADPSIPVATLLRRAKIIAKKLGLRKVDEWIDNELNGYSGELPPYRMIRGRLVGWNPYHGWIPMQGNANIIDILSNASTGQSIDEIESLLQRPGKGQLAVELTPHQVQKLNEMVNVRSPRYVVELDGTALISITNAVRNAVLEWALSLEEHDIKGTAFSFSPEEKQAAKEAGVSYQIGSIGSLVGNLGTGNVSGNISASSVNVEQVRAFSEQITPALQLPLFTEEKRAEIAPLLQELDSECAESKPDQGRLKALLSDIRNALSGAAGNVIATGLVDVIGKMLGGA